MELSKHIIDEARRILQEELALPQQITSAPHFYVAESSDKTILAFSAVEFEGKTFKIGSRKQA